MTARLRSLSLAGWRSYREIESVEPGPLCVLVGANGAGKSNFVSFFAFLHRMLENPGELQLAVAEAGGASRLLHDGPGRTQEITAKIEIETETGLNEYEFALNLAAGDTLVFAKERWGFHREGISVPYDRGARDSGHREARLTVIAHDPLSTDRTPRTIRSMLRRCVPYQFHDTSFNAGVRLKARTANGRHLARDASNLAAVLHHLANSDTAGTAALRRIEETIRRVLPFFAEFVLEPDNGSILLQWRERGSDEIFAASQASDGMLRLIALITLLCRPPEQLPSILLLDEPELGLHPQAIGLLGALLRSASHHCQVIVATQSVPLVDEFPLEKVVVVDRPGRESRIRRLHREEYAAWLEAYSPGELWRMNVLGGGPGS